MSSEKRKSKMNHFTDWIVGGGLLGIFAAIWKNNSDVNSKVGRVYKRFDEYKDHIESRMVSKDVCDVHTRQMVSSIKTIEHDVKELLRRNGG